MLTNTPSSRTRWVHVVAALLGATSLIACGDDGSIRMPTDDAPMPDAGAPMPTPDGGPAPAVDGGPAPDPGPTLPAVASASFVAYGVAQLTFEDAIDADAVTVSLVGSRPNAPAIADWSQDGRETLEVRFDRNHLSTDYTFEIAPNEGGDPVEAFIAGEGNGARVAFVTEGAGNGVIASWAGESSDPLEAADELCNAEAQAAGLRGDFAAYLAIGGAAPTDATCRVVGHHGIYADDCGLDAIRGDDKAIVGVDGRPIAQGADGLAAEDFRSPLRFHADGTLAEGASVWLGTNRSGEVDQTCEDWTSVSSGQDGDSARDIDGRVLDGNIPTECDTVQSLVCMQLPDASSFGVADRHRRQGLTAFVSVTAEDGSFGGLAGADEVCQADAEAAGLANPERFVAYLSDSDDDAACRIRGGSGKQAEGCTFFTEPPADHPGWVALDGSPVAAGPDAITASALEMPLNVDANGDIVNTNQEMWSGSLMDGTGMDATCIDWTSTSIYVNGARGYAGSTGEQWVQRGPSLCFQYRRFYCFELP